MSPVLHRSLQPWQQSEGMRYVIHFVITPTANWDCNELTATFAHALQFHFNKGEALLCQECILCPILIATCPLLATLHRADTNGSNKQRCNFGRSAFRFAVGVESDLRENTDDFRWRHPNLDRPVFSRRPWLHRLKTGPVHRAIKPAGRCYTISLLIKYTGNPELCSFYCSMLHPNNACRKHLTFFLSEKEKSSIQRQWLPAKDLPQL